MRARLDFEFRLEHRKEDITDAIEAVLLTRQFQLEDKSSIELPLEDDKKSKADSSGGLVGRRNQACGPETTLSFNWLSKCANVRGR